LPLLALLVSCNCVTLGVFSLFSRILLSSYADDLCLPSFPTRRSSDLLRCIGFSTRYANLWTCMGITTCMGNTRNGRTYNIHYTEDRKSTRLNSSHVKISYAVFCLKKKLKVISECFIKRLVGRQYVKGS